MKKVNIVILYVIIAQAISGKQIYNKSIVKGTFSNNNYAVAQIRGFTAEWRIIWLKAG
jgi:hypothetical protein